MNILYLTYANPEKENRGDHRYSMDTLRILKNKETHIHLVMMDDRDNPYNRKTSELNNYCETVTVVPFEAKSLIAMALSKYPASIVNRLSMTFIKVVKGILNEGDIDVIVINHFKLSCIC